MHPTYNAHHHTSSMAGIKLHARERRDTPSMLPSITCHRNSPPFVSYSVKDDSSIIGMSLTAYSHDPLSARTNIATQPQAWHIFVRRPQHTAPTLTFYRKLQSLRRRLLILLFGLLLLWATDLGLSAMPSAKCNQPQPLPCRRLLPFFSAPLVLLL